VAGLLAATAVAVAVAVAISVAPTGATAAGVADVPITVVGRTHTLLHSTVVRAPAARLHVSGRTCVVAPDTPLAALLAAHGAGHGSAGGPAVRVRDYAHCSHAARDGTGLFVYQVGPDRNRGRNGWVYKVGHRLGTTGAGDRAGPFGDGHRLGDSQALLWFWCVMRASGCQRTLEATPATDRIEAGRPVTVTVTGYDDRGRGRPTPGAPVELGPVRGLTAPDGRVTLTAPAVAGRYLLTATARGAIPAPTRAVVVG